MSQNLKQKSYNSYEWKFTVSSRYEFRIQSESFILQGQKCFLIFSTSEYVATLKFRSQSILNNAVNFIVVLTKNSDITCTVKQNVKVAEVEIWRYTFNYANDLVNKLLTFEVFLEKDNKFGRQMEPISGKQDQIASYLEKNVHFQAVSRDFSKLMEDHASSDVTITCEDKKYHAHKIVLQTRSEVFSSMLRSDMVEGKTGMVDVKGIKSSIFEIFLRYIYSGILPVLCIDTAKQFYEAADRYSVEELKMACAEFMTKNLSEGNACEILVLADQHSDIAFMKKVISYIVEKKLPKHDRKWPEFCKCHCNLANEVLNIYIEKHCP